MRCVSIPRGSRAPWPYPSLSLPETPEQEGERTGRGIQLRLVLKYQCQYDTELRTRKETGIFTARQKTRPGKGWGLSWQAVGSSPGELRGPPATISKKNVVREGAWPRAKKPQPRRWVGDTFASPTQGAPYPLSILTEQQLSQQLAWLLPFPGPLDQFRVTQLPKTNPSVYCTGRKNKLILADSCPRGHHDGPQTQHC